MCAGATAIRRRPISRYLNRLHEHYDGVQNMPYKEVAMMINNALADECLDEYLDADTSSPLSNPDAETGTAVLERPETKEESKRADDGDADRFAHYVSRDRIAESQATGRPVVALCGKVWVPKHDPSKYPVCPDCKRIYDEMRGW